jgi:Flp pilus assembly protein TadD
MATRNFGAAANLYRQFAAFQPAPPRALLGLGTALGAMNDFRGARQALTRAAEGPDAAVAAEARELLRTLPY